MNLSYLLGADMLKQMYQPLLQIMVQFQSYNIHVYNNKSGSMHIYIGSWFKICDGCNTKGLTANEL